MSCWGSIMFKTRDMSYAISFPYILPVSVNSCYFELHGTAREKIIKDIQGFVIRGSNTLSICGWDLISTY